MNRIDAVFKGLKRRKQKALIAFVTAGDPSLEVTRQFLRFAEEAGVDLVELGVPFSDPLADGPVIQASSFRALKKHVNLSAILKLVREERRRGLKIPVLLMTSVNPIHYFGIKKALAAAKISGIDGFIVPDLPIQESGEMLKLATAFGLHDVLMLTPTTTRDREKKIVRKGHGFLYYVSLTGVTGERKRGDFPFRGEIGRLRRASRTPVCVGFGISTPDQARSIARFSDGVIVGSAIVRHLDAHSKRGLSPASKRLVRGFVNAVKRP